MGPMPKIIAVVGTNASGKSGLAVELALRYSGEVISADSRQVFQGLDLGSGKITPDEMRGVRHHLIDVCQPNEFFSMADFQRQAYRAIEDIRSRGALPFIAGGTGLYVDSVTEGYLLSDRMPDLKYRDELEELTTDQLWAMLKEKEPEIQVDARNRNRVMRILEKIHDGDSAVPGRERRYDSLKLGVTWDREVLAARIEERLERRLAQGMVEEVEGLIARGATEEFLMKLGLEYRFLYQYLTGHYDSLDQMKELLGVAIRQFAKRQMTWFRRDPSIHWLDMTASPVAEACALIDSFLEA